VGFVLFCLDTKSNKKGQDKKMLPRTCLHTLAFLSGQRAWVSE